MRAFLASLLACVPAFAAESGPAAPSASTAVFVSTGGIVPGAAVSTRTVEISTGTAVDEEDAFADGEESEEPDDEPIEAIDAEPEAPVVLSTGTEEGVAASTATEREVEVPAEAEAGAGVSAPGETPEPAAPPSGPPKARAPLAAPPDFRPVYGLHLTAWVAGTSRLRRQFLDKTSGTVINAIVVPIKETDGRVYVPGVEMAREFGTQRLAIPKPEELVADIHERGLKAIARVVVFEDNQLPRRKPEWAIRNPQGGVWENRKRLTWADPYRKEVWEYNFAVAQRAVEAGFDEIQFDYIRYPSDGDIENCRYSNPRHSSSTAVANLLEFLRRAHDRFEAQGIPVSAAVFGLTTSADDDLGIGQDIDEMAPLVDAVSPMMYPSHYARGAYGLAHPNASPYEVIDFGLRDATRRLGANAYKLRPYLQDFSLGVRYREREVREQFRAAQERGVRGWILWNPQNRYTWDALRPPAPRSSIVPPRGF